MNISIHAPNISISEKTREYIECKVLFALSRFQDQISRVELHLQDINGPKGGVDKNCTLNLKGYKSESIVISGKSANLFTVIDQCITRGRSAFVRKMKKSQSFKRIPSLQTDSGSHESYAE